MVWYIKWSKRTLKCMPKRCLGLPKSMWRKNCAHPNGRSHVIHLSKEIGHLLTLQVCFSDFLLIHKGAFTICLSKLKLGTIPILRKQRDWVGRVRKMAMFADVKYYLCWFRVGGSVKVHKCADVIHGWSLTLRYLCFIHFNNSFEILN